MSQSTMGTDLLPLPRAGASRDALLTASRDAVVASRDALVDEFYFAPGRGRSVMVGNAASGAARGGRGFKRSSRSRLLAAMLAAVVVVGAAGFFVMRSGGSAEAMVFKYAFNKGNKQTYALSITLNAVPAGVPDAQSFEGKIDATLGYEVVNTLEDGSSVVDVTLEGVSISPNPSGAPVPTEFGKLTVTVGPDGTVKKVEGSGGVFGAAGAVMGPSSSPMGADPSDSTGSQFLFPQFPTNAIAPGDTWDEDATFPLPFGNQSVTVHTKGKHNGFEDGEHGRVAKFHQSMTSPFDFSFSLAEIAGTQGGAVPPEAQNAVFKITGDMSMDADSLVVPETGDLVRMDGTGKMGMRMQMEGLPSRPGMPTDFAMDVTMKISMIRVSGGAAPADA
jgi:hypothetical protein